MRTFALGLAVAALPGAVQAGAWGQAKGQGQVILKLEAMQADRAFDADGGLVGMGPRRDTALQAFGEYGVSDRFTLQFKGDWQDGRDAVFDYQGRGPVEVGVTWRAFRSDRTAASLYAGYADTGDARNAGYAAPGVGERDWEVRGSIGRTLEGRGGRFAPDRSFVEIQAARRMRDGLPDETRVDLTAGAHFGDGWLALAQAYAGAADGDNARWLSLEASVVRTRGAWSLQAGWRRAVAGRWTPESQGPVIAVWRRF